MLTGNPRHNWIGEEVFQTELNPLGRLEKMATRRKIMKKKHPDEKCELKVFDFTHDDVKKELSGSEDDGRDGELAVAH